MIKACKIATVCSLLMLLFTACGSIPEGQREGVRRDIDNASKLYIDKISEKNPKLQRELNESLGYFVSTGWTGMLGVIGRTDTIGVLVDKRDGSKLYMDVEAFDVGVGLGASDLSVVIIFNKPETLDTFKKGDTYSRADIINLVGADYKKMNSPYEGVSVHIFSDVGGGVSAGASMTTVSINEDLNDVGLSEMSVPVRSKNNEMRLNRQWDRAMPLLGQKVIDKGYNLPLPYGVALFYGKLEQEMYLSNLKVGVNGSHKQSINFVSFDQAKTETETAQLKFDMWLLPFMNVFATLGQVQGDSAMDVVIDGDAMLVALNNDCSKPLEMKACNALQGKTLYFPVEPKIDVRSLTLGTIVAAGWGDWFVAAPLSWSMVEQRGFVAGGLSFTAGPRFGRIFTLENYGRLSLFAGGNYLDSELEVEGAISIPQTDIMLDYSIDQKNKSQWNTAVGFNWDVSKRFSWSVEYNGIQGSREALLTGLTLRY